MFEKKNLTVLSDHYAKLKADDEDSEEESDEEDEFLKLARKDHDIEHVPEVWGLVGSPGYYLCSPRKSFIDEFVIGPTNRSTLPPPPPQREAKRVESPWIGEEVHFR